MHQFFLNVSRETFKRDFKIFVSRETKIKYNN